MGTRRTSREGGDQDDPFRPKMGRRQAPDRDRAPSFRGQLARAIAQRGGFKTGLGRTASKRRRIAVRAPHALGRRCIVKARYVSMRANGRKIAKAHLAYLERDGVERDGSKGQLYGRDQTFDAEAFRAPVAGEPRQFRFIVSPEDADWLDLKEFTRQFMRQVEKDTGRHLEWAAVNHHNTDNPHVHIVVRGLDRDGDEVRIDGRYIAREMRWRAQEIVTRELGPRPEVELSRGQDREVERARYTCLDQMIEALAKPDRTISLQEILGQQDVDGRRCIARLNALKDLDLAKVEASGRWRLADGWTGSLQEMGDYQDAVERLRPIVGERAHGFQILDERSAAAAFEARVIGKGLDDELGGRMFVAVQTPAGQDFFVRVAPEVGEPIREGDTIRVRFQAEGWVKPADKIVARFAEFHGGIYDPDKHRRELEALPRAAGGAGEPTPDDRITANVRRLERLERYQLATRLPDGRWRIPGDFLSQLADRERTHPQQQMQVERVGPDRSPSPTRAPTPARPPATRAPAPERSELAVVASSATKELHLAYVSEPPTFRGNAMELRKGPSGREYAVVADYRRGQFTVIPKPADWDRLHGRTVHLARDRGQKLTIQVDRGLER